MNPLTHKAIVLSSALFASSALTAGAAATNKAFVDGHSGTFHTSVHPSMKAALGVHNEKLQLVRLGVEKLEIGVNSHPFSSWSHNYDRLLNELLDIRSDAISNGVRVTDHERKIWFDLERAMADLSFMQKENPPLITEDGYDEKQFSSPNLITGVNGIVKRLEPQLTVGTPPVDRSYINLSWAAARMGNTATVKKLLAKQMPYELRDTEGKPSTVTYDQLEAKIIAISEGVALLREGAYNLSQLGKWSSYFSRRDLLPGVHNLESTFLNTVGAVIHRLEVAHEALDGYNAARVKIAASPLRKEGFAGDLTFLHARTQAVVDAYDLLNSRHEAAASSALTLMLQYRRVATRALLFKQKNRNIPRAQNKYRHDTLLNYQDRLEELRKKLVNAVGESDTNGYANMILAEGEAFERRLMSNIRAF